MVNQMSEGELKKRIVKESHLIDVSRTSHGDFLFEQEQLENMFNEMEIDSCAKYPVTFDFSTFRIIDDANKELEEIMSKYKGIELLHHIGQAWLELQNWKNKHFGESS